MTAPGLCLCGRSLPARPPYQKPAIHCSWWCRQVSLGTYTLAQVEPMLARDRGPVLVAEPDLFGGES